MGTPTRRLPAQNAGQAGGTQLSVSERGRAASAAARANTERTAAGGVRARAGEARTSSGRPASAARPRNASTRAEYCRTASATGSTCRRPLTRSSARSGVPWHKLSLYLKSFGAHHFMWRHMGPMTSRTGRMLLDACVPLRRAARQRKVAPTAECPPAASPRTASQQGRRARRRLAAPVSPAQRLVLDYW